MIKLIPLPASLFRKFPAQAQKDFIASLVVPVNDVFLPEWNSTHSINLFYGSYGSGKSIFIADLFIKHALEDEYFRGYYGHKILDKVRGTVFQTIVDRISELGLDNEFYFSKAPNGTMLIQCKSNGNSMLPFGADNPQSLKSIKDPTHFFCEEFDQFSFVDFGVIYSRLRTEKAITQFYGAFNTERIYKSHWIRKNFFDGEFADKSFKLLANYTDNYFINQVDYLEKLKIIAGGNAAVLNSISRGTWGTIKTGAEFLDQFNESKHVKPVKITNSTIHISLDNNNNPYVTCSIWQIDELNKTIKQVHEIAATEPNNNAPKAAKLLVKWLLSIKYEDTIFVYGDPSANARSTVDENNASFFDKYIGVLKEYGFSVQKRVKRSAPQISLSRDFVNTILETNYNGWSITIHDECFISIEDYMQAKVDREGRMLKTTTKDENTGVTYEPIGHFTDALRYIICALLENEFKNFNNRKRFILETM